VRVHACSHRIDELFAILREIGPRQAAADRPGGKGRALP
jgi:hypothetical protein